MMVLDNLASVKGVRSDQPNIDLAVALVELRDEQAVAELVKALRSQEKRLRNDCIKVLYEIGYRKPEMIAPYVEDFLQLLTEKNNRLVWGGMIALSTVADLKAVQVYAHLGLVKRIFEKGSVITQDAGMRVLAKTAAHSSEYNLEIFPYLLEQLRICRPKSLAQYAESVQAAVNAENLEAFLEVLAQRKSDLSTSQVKRVEKLTRSLAT